MPEGSLSRRAFGPRCDSSGGDEVEITLEGERIELVPAPRQVSLRKGSHGLLTSDLELPGQGPDEVREALERTRP